MISNVKMIVQEINFVHIGWLDPQAELRLQLVDSPSLCPPIFWFGCYSGLTAPVILHLYPAARSLSTNKNWGESLDTILLSGWRTKTFLKCRRLTQLPSILLDDTLTASFVSEILLFWPCSVSISILNNSEMWWKFGCCSTATVKHLINSQQLPFIHFKYSNGLFKLFHQRVVTQGKPQHDQQTFLFVTVQQSSSITWLVEPGEKEMGLGKWICVTWVKGDKEEGGPFWNLLFFSFQITRYSIPVPFLVFLCCSCGQYKSLKPGGNSFLAG